MSRRFTRIAGTIALSCAALLAVPTTALATPASETPVAAPVSGDLLSQAVSALQSRGVAAGDPALAAAEAIASTRTDVADPVTDASPLGALDAVNKILTDLGITPFFYPTAAINCAGASGAPLGIVPGVAGAAGGPWPNLTIPIPAPLPQLPALNAVEKGETMFAFVPAGIVGDGGNKTGMQVAWFNVNTFQGGFADMGGATTTLVKAVLDNLDVPPAIKAAVAGPLEQALSVLPSAGARAVPVETGSGTVLAAVFGTVNNTAADGTSNSCFFFPTIGMVNVA